MSERGRSNPLRRHGHFRRLWAARTISRIGDGIAVIALVLLVQGRRGTGVAVGTLLLVKAVPQFLGPYAGVLADRLDQRRLMVACDLGNAAIFAGIAGLDPSFPILLAMVGASSVLDTVFAPAGRSVIPALVPVEDLLQANSWMGTSLNLQVALGPVLGGALVAWLGTRGALAANALTFLLSAGILLTLPALRAGESDRERGFLAGGTEGLRFAWRTPVLRWLMLALFFGVAFAAVDNVALVFLVRDTLGGGPLAFGLASAGYGVGMIAASMGFSWRRTGLAMATVLLIGWFLSGAGTLLTGLAPALVVVAVTQVVAGAGNGMENLAGDTLIQRIVPRGMLGRAFGLVSTAAFGGGALAYAVGGFLLDLTSPRALFVIGGAGVLVVTLGLLTVFRSGSPELADT